MKDPYKKQMTNKEKYKEFCNQTPLPIFSQNWWLDAVCGPNNWDVGIIEKGGEVVATLPYYLKRKGPFKIITMPPLTQTMGPWIKFPEDQKHATKLSYEKEIMNTLIEQLPTVDYFCQNFHHTITNWLPFHWNNYTQTTRYTYVLNNIENTKTIYSDFNQAKKKNIKKASKLLTVKYDLSAIKI